MKKLAILVLTLTLIIIGSGLVMADTSSLPDASLFTPDLAASASIIGPFLGVVNLAIGIAGLVLIVMGVGKALRGVWEYYRGSGQNVDYGPLLKRIGIGMGIAFFAMTGLWYRMLVFIWKLIVPNLEGKITAYVIQLSQMICG